MCRPGPPRRRAMIVAMSTASDTAGDRTAPSPFEPARLGPLTLRNRIIKAATFEGVMPRGAVTDELIEFHRAVAAGGAALTTVAYCAVSKGGRVHRHTLVMRRAHRRRTCAASPTPSTPRARWPSAQIGHAGLVANTRSNGTPTLAPSHPVQRPGHGPGARRPPWPSSTRSWTSSSRAARVAVDAGFDAIEIHLGPQLPAELVPQPQPQQAHRRATAAASRTGPASPAGSSRPSGGAVGRSRGGARPSSTWPTA